MARQPDYSYQPVLVGEVFQHWTTSPIVVLAASPNAGKTKMAEDIRLRYEKEFGVKPKTLILTHGTNLLRNQWHKGYENRTDISYCLADRGFDPERLHHSDVIVTLPQTLHPTPTKFNLPAGFTIDLLIVDEAHQRYFAKQIQELIEVFRPKHQLLLTGTPSPFVRSNNEGDYYPMSIITLQELLDRQVAVSPIMELALSTYTYTPDDLTQYQKLSQDAEPQLGQELKVSASLDEVLSAVEHRLTSMVRDNPKLYSWVTRNPLTWRLFSKNLGKTMVICRSQDQAKQVHSYFLRKEVSSILSISDLGDGIQELDEFMSDKAKIFVVVERGSIGFNYPLLMNLIDMGMSHDPDDLYQTICRLVRPNDLSEMRKLWVKVTTPELAEMTRWAASFAVALSHPRYFSTYDGNYRKVAIPVKRERSGGEGGGGSGPGKLRPDLPKLMTFEDIHHIDSAPYGTYAYTTFRLVRSKLDFQTESDYPSSSEALAESASRTYCEWTKETVFAEAGKFGSLRDWYTNSLHSYQFAKKREWFQELRQTLFPDAKKPKGHWTKENCLADAQKYKTFREWRENSSGSVTIAQKSGWSAEIQSIAFPDMTPKCHWTKENCLADARKYDTFPQWVRESKSAYNAACRKKFLKEVVAIAFPNYIPRGSLTREDCLADAMTYKSYQDWSKTTSWRFAYSQDWHVELAREVFDYRVRGTLTLDEVLATLEGCVDYADWRHKHPDLYSMILKKGWVKHIKPRLKPAPHRMVAGRIWTKDRCIEEARRFSTLREWREGHRKSHTPAYRNGWEDEICALVGMKRDRKKRVRKPGRDQHHVKQIQTR